MARIHAHADPFEIDVDTLAGDTIAVDAHLMLYQQIKGKRGQNGKAVTNQSGKEIAHLLGTWERTAFYLENDIEPVYVFEGGMPDLKVEEHERRRSKTENAKKNFEAAKERGDEEAMEKWGARADTLSYDQIDEVQHLLDLMGVCVVEAPSEADPQCGQLSQEGAVDYVHTEDFDHLLHGVDNLIRRFDDGVGQMVARQQLLDDLGYTHEQMVWRQIVAGCDYTTGPNRVAWGRASNMVADADCFEDVIDATLDYCSERDELAWNPDRWRAAWDWFKDPNVEEGIELESGHLSVRDTREYLVDENGLDGSRVRGRLRSIVEG